MDEWSERVDRWQGWAREQGMSLEFCYWGEHELWERLSKEEHRGRYFFWFNKEFFSRQWFANLVAEAIANAGPRYTPEIHVGLPIADLFEGLGRTGTFYTRINEAYGAAKNLVWNGIDGHFFDSNGEIVALDPSVNQRGPSALLLNKDKFLRFLRDVDCDILWTVIGEKMDFDYGSHGITFLLYASATHSNE